MDQIRSDQISKLLQSTMSGPSRPFYWGQSQFGWREWWPVCPPSQEERRALYHTPPPPPRPKLPQRVDLMQTRFTYTVNLYNNLYLCEPLTGSIKCIYHMFINSINQFLFYLNSFLNYNFLWFTYLYSWTTSNLRLKRK